jgi:hypothetical protein
MISTPDRQQAVKLINEARASGARLKPACQELGLDVCTYWRWTREGVIKVDGRPEAVRPVPANKLSPEERAQVLALRGEPAVTRRLSHRSGRARLTHPAGRPVRQSLIESSRLVISAGFLRVSVLNRCAW